MATRKSNPDNKMRADGTLLGGKAAQRQGKAYKASGKPGSRNMEVGRGSRDRAIDKLWKWLNGDDESGR